MLVYFAIDLVSWLELKQLIIKLNICFYFNKEFALIY